jgi:low affinity Fe/Cu permease
VSASQFFSQAAQWTSRQCGRPLTFGLASGVVVVWAVPGPLFNYSDTWQLVINTGTTIVTFLMVFLIQNTQNRDASAVQLKLDELIRVSTTARNKFLTLEDLTEAELDQLKQTFAQIADRGGVGEGELREIETGLGQAEGQIEKAKDKIAPGKSWHSSADARMRRRCTARLDPPRARLARSGPAATLLPSARRRTDWRRLGCAQSRPSTPLPRMPLGSPLAFLTAEPTSRVLFMPPCRSCARCVATRASSSSPRHGG